jgi:hypothetical protein
MVYSKYEGIVTASLLSLEAKSLKTFYPFMEEMIPLDLQFQRNNTM